MSKATVSRFFATLGAAALIVTCFVVGIPHVFLGEGWAFWLTFGLASSMTAFAIDHWPSKA